jgi:phytoene synthase
MASSAEELAATYEYCRQIISRAAKTFYLGSLLLPAQKRRAVWAIYAFCRTVDDVVDMAPSQAKAAEQLCWWRSALEQVYAGVSEHPILLAWADTLKHYPVPLQPALDLLDGMAMDLDFQRERFATFHDLAHYCYCVAGTVGLLTAPILGYQQEEALESAVNLGIAMQLTNILRDIGADARQGRIYLPIDEMARFGYSDQQVQQGCITDAFRQLMDFQITRAERYYQEAETGIALLDADARFSIQVSSSLYRQILACIRRNHYDVFTRRAHVPFPLKATTLSTHWLRLKLKAPDSTFAPSQMGLP